jgi:hypothetical protein
MDSVIAVEKSDNAKTGPVSATYVSQASCPADCPLRGSGCYAESGPVGIITRRLTRSGEGSPLELARREAQAIGRLSGRRDLRVHVVGDCRTEKAARIVARAMRRHRGKVGMRAWTYTHAWKRVRRTAWEDASVLASCETVEEVRHARARGYATALVVDSFATEKAHDVAPGVCLLPCPNQTRGVTCERCGLCMDDQRLHRAGLTIGFAAHGSGKGRVLRAVEGKRLALTVL